MDGAFYKMGKELAARRDLRPSDKLVFAVIVDFRGNPGKRFLANATGLSGQAVCDAIKRLERSGVLIVSRATGKRNHYDSGQEFRPVKRPDHYRSRIQTGTGTVF